MEYFILGMALLVIILLLIGLVNYSSKKHTSPKKRKKTNTILQKCPICDSPLFPGENIISKVYRPMNVPDQLCTISGCPHCYPSTEKGVSRICPVCHSSIPLSGYLTARLFNEKNNKKHVHILGCQNCRKSN
jgi:RNase P subunit RPR2